MDLSMAAYLSIIPFICAFIGLFTSSSIFKNIAFGFHYIFLMISIIVILADIQIYNQWASHLDLSALRFLKYPLEILASLNYVMMILFVVIIIISIFVSKKIVHFIQSFFPNRIAFKPYFLSMLLIILGLIVPIRGGFGKVPLNLSSVFFSQNQYHNMLSINPLWNLVYDIVLHIDNPSQEIFMTDKQSANLLNIYKNKADSSIYQFNKPNIILIVLESMMAKIANDSMAMPQFHKLKKKGLYFSQCISTGDRSDMGLISLFSGQTSFPDMAVSAFPNQFSKLPSLFKIYNQNGYHSSFMYGGNLDFANLKSYFLQTQCQEIIDQKHKMFKGKKANWGWHDEVTFNAFYSHIAKSKKPYFNALFSLSNHEPFDLPFYKFGKHNGDAEYKSGSYYTDSCLGVLINQIFTNHLDSNTLIIITADHSTMRLGISDLYDIEKFKIPILLLYPKLEHKIVPNPVSQLQIFSTLSQILNQNNSYFQSLLSTQPLPSFTPYFYWKGIGNLHQSKHSIYDFTQKKYIKSNQHISDSIGMAFYQYQTQLFNKLSLH